MTSINTTPAAVDTAPAKKVKKSSDSPTVLAFRRAINPGHFLMSSIDSEAEKQTRTALVVREEPLRGMNATNKTVGEGKCDQAVLQIVETCELAPGDDTLVLAGKMLVNNAMTRPHSCNSKEFAIKHRGVINSAISKGLVKDLAIRYAMTVAAGNWGWRNALESDAIQVEVKWKVSKVNRSVTFTDMMLSNEDTFDINLPEYADNKEALIELADAIEVALIRKSGFGTRFSIVGSFSMGLGARVYPSQEWASETMKAKSKKIWDNDKGVTRILAKLTKNGVPQAILNDRKVGNAIRVIDTWYEADAKGAPIAVEPFGGNSHQSVALRTSPSSSMFGMLKSVHDEVALTDDQLSFYTAASIRGGVFSGKE
jgi:CRISPR-associated protein Csy3